MASRKYEKLKKQKDVAISEIKNETVKLEAVSQEAKRVSDISKNVSIILADLDKQFEQATKLTGMDISFLFFATALQCIRQYILTPFKERQNDKDSAKKAHEEGEKIFGKESWDKLRQPENNKRYYVSSKDIIDITKGVPYDAIYGSKDFNLGGIGKGFSGNTHRFLTLGHDPLFGWVFGTANIMTNTLTTWSLQSYHVKPSSIANGAMRDKIVQHANTALMFEKVMERSKEEPLVLAAAVIKQRLHLKSDMFSTAGLPIPGTMALSPETAQKLSEHGIDLGNVAVLGKQITYSVFINTLVAIIHGLFYDESFGSKSFYEVRTRKILSYSNLIASASNLIGVAIAEAVAVGTGNTQLGKDAMRYLDIGGLAVTIYRVVNDKKFIQQIKQEFLEKEFYDMVMGKEIQ